MRKRIFFICGSMNQTTQMHQVSEHLREYEQSFSPYYVHGFDEILRRLGVIEFTVAGNKLAGRCAGIFRIMAFHRLPGKESALRPGGYLLGRVPSEEHFEAIGLCWFRKGLQTGIHDVPSCQATPIPSSLVCG